MTDAKNITQKIQAYYKTSTKYLEQLNSKEEDFFNGYVRWVLHYAQRGYRVLDLGCGNGMSSFLLNKRGLNVVGSDISHLFLKNKGEYISPSLSFITADAQCLPFKENSFDLVSSMSLLEHVPDTEKFLSEMIRVAKPGGIILIMAPNLLSPIAAIKVFLTILFKRGSMPGFASTLSEALRMAIKNFFISCKKLSVKKSRFLYRLPQLDRLYTGDVDSVYLACQIDLKYFFRERKLQILEYASNDGLSFLGKLAAKIFPDFCGACSIAVKKLITQIK